MKRKIAISGIHGFLGRHLLKALQNDYEVLGIVRSIDSEEIRKSEIVCYTSDDYGLQKLFKEQKLFAVIHTATVYRINDSILDVLKTNLLLPIRLYELANKQGCELFVNTDTFINVPDITYDYLMNYSLSKRNALEWLKCINNNCRCVNMKLFHMYGPGDSPNKFVTKILHDLKDEISQLDLTPGEQKRDFIYVADVVSAFKTVLDNYERHDKWEEYEVGLSHSVSIKNFVQLAKKLLKSNTKLNFGALNYRRNEFEDAKAENSKLLDLGWKPLYTLEEGVLETSKSL